MPTVPGRRTVHCSLSIRKSSRDAPSGGRSGAALDPGESRGASFPRSMSGMSHNFVGLVYKPLRGWDLTAETCGSGRAGARGNAVPAATRPLDDRGLTEADAERRGGHTQPAVVHQEL